MRGIFTISLLLCTTAAMAAEPKPDLSEPKPAAFAFAAAFAAGDLQTTKSLCTDMDLHPMLADYARVQGAIKRFHHAVARRFGENVAALCPEYGNEAKLGSQPLSALIAESQQEIFGDAATLTHKSPPLVVHLRRTEGQWKIARIVGLRWSLRAGAQVMKPLAVAMDDAARDVERGRIDQPHELPELLADAASRVRQDLQTAGKSLTVARAADVNEVSAEPTWRALLTERERRELQPGAAARE